jgi:uncharacterized membrane protein YbhN (UPF0104 family)
MAPDRGPAPSLCRRLGVRLASRAGAIASAHGFESRAQVTTFSLLSTLLALGAMAGVAQIAGLEGVERVIVSPHLAWFAVAAGAVVLSYAGYLVAYREVARVEGGERLPLRQAGALVASGFGLFVPGGGFAVDVSALQRMNVPKSEARIRILGLGVLEYAVLAPAACIAAAILVARGAPVGSALTWPWLLAVPLGTVAAVCVFVRGSRLRRDRWWRRALGTAVDGLRVFTDLWRESWRLVVALAGMALYWAAEILLLWATLHAFLGRAPSLPALILAYATGYALTRRTLPLAGAGVVDFCLPLALSWVSIPLASALVAVFAYRVFNLWIPLAPALVGRRHVADLASG